MSADASIVQERTAFLDKDGKPLSNLPEFARNRAILVSMYEAMVRARAFDRKAIELQRTGRLGTYASCLGQEAIGVGVASAMDTRDVLLPSFREHAAQLIRGVTLFELFLYWGGDERGNNYSAARSDFPVCIPVASHFPHAVGVALTKAVSQDTGAAVAIGGDGATSKGEFYEALNLIGVWNLPAVFVINNNQWAISVPRAQQTAAETLAQKAIAAGLPGEQVDGNDVIAVHDATRRALKRVHDHGSPTLIECVSYRLSDHTTADNASRYRDDAEVSAHWVEEPVLRLRKYLTEAHDWNKEEEEELLKVCDAEVGAAAEAYLATEPEAPTAMFANLHESSATNPEFIKMEAGDG